MSEYQYYEFQAIDRPLSEQQMRKLRSFSTRAHVTPTGLVNDYGFGSFKGDVDVWMERVSAGAMRRFERRTHASPPL